MKPINLLKERIFQKVLLSDVLKDYHVEFTYNPDAADEVQYRCPIHGKDNKPSARFYKETQTSYCWFCHKKWDTITFIADKENLGYIESIKFILSKYKVDISDLPDLDINNRPAELSSEDRVVQENIFIISLRGKIREFRGKLGFEKYRDLCGVFQMILFEKFKNKNVMPLLIKLESKLNKVSYE